MNNSRVRMIFALLVVGMVISIGGKGHATTLMLVPPEEYVVSPGEVPASCGFSITELIAAFVSDPPCDYSGGIHFLTMREDSMAFLLHSGDLHRVYGNITGGRICLPCCYEDPPHPIEPPGMEVTSELSFSRTRHLDFEIGAEVEGGGAVGLPFIAELEIKARLSGQIGFGGDTQVSHSISVTFEVLKCQYRKSAITGYVRKNAVWAINHTYRFIAFPVGDGCPDRHVLAVCPDARQSRLKSEDWGFLLFNAEIIDEGACHEEPEIP